MANLMYDMLPETTYYFKVQAVDNHFDALKMSDVVEYTHPAGKMNFICKGIRLYKIFIKFKIKFPNRV